MPAHHDIALMCTGSMNAKRVCQQETDLGVFYRSSIGGWGGDGQQGNKSVIYCMSGCVGYCPFQHLCFNTCAKHEKWECMFSVSLPTKCFCWYNDDTKWYQVFSIHLLRQWHYVFYSRRDVSGSTPACFTHVGSILSSIHGHGSFPVLSPG